MSVCGRERGVREGESEIIMREREEKRRFDLQSTGD
jgi:hypothetical protein